MVSIQQVIDEAEVLREAKAGMKRDKTTQRQAKVRSTLEGTRKSALRSAKFSRQRLQVRSKDNKRGLLPSVTQSRKLQSGTAGLARALGVPTRHGYNPTRGTGMRGRPPGSGKYQKTYGMGVIEYRRLQAQRRAFAKMQQDQLQQELLQKGYTPDEVEVIRQQKLAAAPEESYEEFVQKNTISPNTLAMLERLRQIQNKARTDDLNMQRVMRERRMLNEAANILEAPNMFKASDRDMNILDMEYNILKAPNYFAARPDMPHVLNTKKLHIMQTKEAGNDLKFF